MSKQKKAKISRREARRQQQAREKRMRQLRLWGPITVIGLAIVGLILFRAFQPDVEGTVFVTAEVGGNHDAELVIPFGGLPPTGGPHNPSWQNCGIYDMPVEGQYAIHSMEHGAVWVTYHPDLPSDEIALLRDTLSGESYVILSPYPDQAAPLVLTVWDAQLVLETAVDDRVEQFINRYGRVRGPEAGASCANGIGVPTG